MARFDSYSHFCRTNKDDRPVVLDIAGQDGNAFFLLGKMKDIGRQVGKTKEELSALSEDATSGDYEHLVKVVHSVIGFFTFYENVPEQYIDTFEAMGADYSEADEGW